MTQLLNLFKIDDDVNNIDFVKNDPFKDHKYERTLRQLDYFKDVTAIALMPELVKSYKQYISDKIKLKNNYKNEDIKLKASEVYIKEKFRLDWNAGENSYIVDINNEHIDFNDFFSILTNQLASYSFPFNKPIVLYVNNNNEILEYARSDATLIEELAYLKQYQKELTVNFNKKDLTKEHTLETAKKLLEVLDVIEDIKIDIAKTKSEYQWCGAVIGLIDSYINEIKKLFKTNRYMALGIYRERSNASNLSQKAIPFSIHVEVQFNYLLKDKILLKPLELIKLSNKNISIDKNIDTETYENVESKGFSEEKALTIDFVTWEKTIKEQGLKQNNVFLDNVLCSKNKWNTLLSVIQEIFNMPEDTIIEDKIIFFEPLEEIKSLYEAYTLSIETILRNDELTDNLMKNSLLPKLLSNNVLTSKETLNEQINKIYNKTDSLGLLKENIIYKDNKFDYFSLNSNQRIFSYKALYNFATVSNNEKSNIIALNGPPGTGKTTVLQTVVATNIVDKLLQNKENDIIFGCSATRQAKDNIISGFKHDTVHTKGNMSLYQRWIKFYLKEKDVEKEIDVDYGLSLEKKDAPIVLIKGLYKNITKVEQYYLDCYKNADRFIISNNQIKSIKILNKIFDKDINYYKFKSSNSIDSITNELLSLLKKVKLDLDQTHSYKVNAINSLAEFVDGYKIIENIDFNPIVLSSLEKQIDTLNEDYNISKEKLKEYISDREKEIKIYLAPLQIRWNSLIAQLENITRNSITSFFNKKDKQIEELLIEAISQEWVKEYGLIDLITELFNQMKDDKKKLQNYRYESIVKKIIIPNKFNLKLEQVEEEIKKIEQKKKDYLSQYEIELNKKNKYENTKKIESENEKIVKSLQEEINRLTEIFREDTSSTCLRLVHLNEQLAKKDLSNVISEIEDILNIYIDNVFKTTLFHLAMRYQEGTFITDLKKIKNADKPFGQGFRGIKEKYKMCAKITPVFVSTMHGLSTRIEYFNQKIKSGISFVDLLIVDEAGQIAPEVGGISLLLSKKALIVGDTAQIEPVYNIEKDFNFELYKIKFETPELDESDFNTNVWNCSTSSIMKVAQNYGLWHQYPTLEKGLYLVEHNRCPIELIQFCDELIYKNNLKYTITSYYESEGNAKYINKIETSLNRASYKLGRNNKIQEENLFLPNQKPWQFIGHDFEGEANTLNTKEIELILEWLDNNYDTLMLNAGDKQLKQIVAIITPFSKQALKIKELGKKYDFKSKLKDMKQDLFDDHRKKDSTAITIGTVHSLQGAEIPIVLFSNVYGANSKTNQPFIDRQQAIINVGVSRAKQSFFVFGNKYFFERIYNQATLSGEYGSTALLYKYLISE